MNNRNKIIAGILLLLVIIFGAVMMSRQTKLVAENKQLTSEVDSLQKQKTLLLTEIDGLSTEGLRHRNCCAATNRSKSYP